MLLHTPAEITLALRPTLLRILSKALWSSRGISLRHKEVASRNRGVVEEESKRLKADYEVP